MSIADELTQLAELHAQGALSADDYAAAKAKVLSNNGATGALQTATDPDQLPDVLGLPLIILPLAGLALLATAYFKIAGSFRLLEARGIVDSTKMLYWAGVALVILGSAVLVAIDATRYGFGRDKVHPIKAMRTPPAVWAVAQVLLWLVAFPWYVDVRRKASKRAMALTVAALLLALAFTAASLALNWVIDERVSAINSQMGGIRRSLGL